MNTNQLEFATFCIGNVSKELHLTQPVVYQKLVDSNILNDFIIQYYDELHTYGRKYLVEEIISLMTERGVLSY